MKKIIILVFMIVLVSTLVYSTCFDTGDGSDGALTVTSTNIIINDYTRITTASVSSGSTSFDVNSASEFSVGDEILIIQMQHSSNAGVYEFANIFAINSNAITISESLSNSYASGTFDSGTSTAAQIVKVPQYTSVTIDSGASLTASAWDGYKGGILVFRASGDVNVTGIINLTGKGFRGGDRVGSFQQGESYNGRGSGNIKSANYGGGGSGTTGGGNEPGAGGGGFGTAGQNGEDDEAGAGGTGGSTYGVANLSKIYFGSGGGASGTSDTNDGNGGAGGGIVMIYSATTTTSGNILSEGADGLTANSVYGGAGAGSGGSIQLTAINLIIGGIKVKADGGTGGDPGGSGVGGDGGSGRIRLDYSGLSGTTSPSASEGSGATLCAPNIFGIVKDSSGSAVENATVIIHNQANINQGSFSNSFITTSNSTGGWSYAVASGTYLIVAYDSSDSSTAGSVKPHIVVS